MAAADGAGGGDEHYDEALAYLNEMDAQSESLSEVGDTDDEEGLAADHGDDIAPEFENHADIAHDHDGGAAAYAVPAAPAGLGGMDVGEVGAGVIIVAPVAENAAKWFDDGADVPMPAQIIEMPYAPATTGVKVPTRVRERLRPVEFFRCFIDTNWLSHVTLETNLYHSQKEALRLQKEGAAALPEKCKWTPLSNHELERFIAILLATGINRLPSFRSYWKSHAIESAPGIAAIMDRPRFEMIKRYLHFNDNSNEIKDKKDPAYDKLYKIQPLLTSFRAKCLKLWVPPRELSLDEQRMKFKGHSSMKQYNPMKPIKRGIQTYALAFAKSGYIYDFFVYTGSSKDERVPDLENPDANADTDPKTVRSIVMKLVQPHVNKGHHIYLDNWFTSHDLARDLAAVGTYVCGTIQLRRIGNEFPQEEFKDKSVEVEGKKRKQKVKVLETRGQWLYRRCRDSAVSVWLWLDSKYVQFISTIHGRQETQINRNTKVDDAEKKKKVWKPIAYSCPSATADYCKFMGGVDIGDQLRATYTCRFRSKKWTNIVFTFMIDTAVANSWLIYRECGGTLSHLDYLLSVIEALASTDRRPETHKRRRREYVQKHEAISKPERELLRTGSKGEHWPEQTGSHYTRCYHCRRYHEMENPHRSTVQCSLCKVCLCNIPCFREYHQYEGEYPH